MAGRGNVEELDKGKSIFATDGIIKYCADMSIHLHPLQKELLDATLTKTGWAKVMIGAPEVLEFGANMIHLIGGRNCLDIGTFTGASAFAWALALPADGKVISMDVSHEHLNAVGRPIIEKDKQATGKIDFRLAPALNTLDSLIADGKSGTFDFAFIDADKTNYVNYYEKCLQLLRSGGIILVDNALWNGAVLLKDKDESTKCIDNLNRLVYADNRVNNSLLTLGDGTHVIFKK